MVLWVGPVLGKEMLRVFLPFDENRRFTTTGWPATATLLVSVTISVTDRVCNAVAPEPGQLLQQPPFYLERKLWETTFATQMGTP